MLFLVFHKSLFYLGLSIRNSKVRQQILEWILLLGLLFVASSQSVSELEPTSQRHRYRLHFFVTRDELTSLFYSHLESK